MTPTKCHDIKIVIITTGMNMAGFQGDDISWELYEKQSNQIHLEENAVNGNQTSEYEVDCLEENDYVFSITNDKGKGFGECETCGYSIFVDEAYIGGSTSFYYNEKLSFSLPVHYREEQPVDSNGSSICSGDFFLMLRTDDHPEEITWNLINDEGNVVLTGEKYFTNSNRKEVLFELLMSRPLCFCT